MMIIDDDFSLILKEAKISKNDVFMQEFLVHSNHPSFSKLSLDTIVDLVGGRAPPPERTSVQLEWSLRG